MKATDITILDLRAISEVTDFFVICTVDSSRQLRAIWHSIHVDMKKAGAWPLGEEGLDASKWILIDYVDVIVHIFLAEFREFYDLELLWGDAPRIKWQPANKKKE